MRTFIGELVFRFRDDASAKAKQTASSIGGAVTSIEQAARRLNSMPFGGRFTAQLDKLGASASDLDRVREAWERLQASMASRNLSKAAARTEIENFRVATLGHFASIRSASDAHMRETEKRTRLFANNLQTIMKPALVAMGGYTGAYMVGVGARAGLTAASRERKEQGLQHFAGLPQTEQDQITSKSQALSTEYGVTQADVMEIMREARLAMPTAEAAFGVAEEMVQAFKMLQLRLGPQEAVDGLRVLTKAFDNIALNERPEAIKQALEAYIKAQQIAGAELSPAEMAMAIKYARASGKVFSEEFLFNWLPFLIAEVGGADTGTQLRAGFDQFITGKATKESLENQRKFGLRDKDDRLVAQEEFTQNPVTWINKYLLPALEKNGVTRENETEMARVIGELTSNRLAGDLVMRLIDNYAQYQRQVELAANAVGLEGAKQVDFEDPFSALERLRSAFRNLSSALLPMDAISAGLVSFADSINTLQESWRDGDIEARLKIGAAGAGAAFGAWKVAGAIWGLMTAGTNLNLAAASLQAAAVSLGAGGAVGNIGGNAGRKGLLRRLFSSPAAMAAMAGAGTIVGLGLLGQDANKENKKGPYRDYSEGFSRDENAVRNYKQWHGVPFEGGMHRAGLGAGPMPGVAEAQQAGDAITDALSVTAKPTVDTSDLEATLNLINQIKTGLNGIGATISAAAQKARQQADAEVRRSMSDYGVSP